MKLGRGERNISVSGVECRPVDAAKDNGWGSESDWKSTASRLPNSSSVFLVITKEPSETVDNHSVAVLDWLLSSSRQAVARWGVLHVWPAQSTVR